jgi:cbb3-type cytochrome oxidase subunit 3
VKLKTSTIWIFLIVFCVAIFALQAERDHEGNIHFLSPDEASVMIDEGEVVSWTKLPEGFQLTDTLGEKYTTPSSGSLLAKLTQSGVMFVPPEPERSRSSSIIQLVVITAVVLGVLWFVLKKMSQSSSLRSGWWKHRGGRRAAGCGRLFA